MKFVKSWNMRIEIIIKIEHMKNAKKKNILRRFVKKILRLIKKNMKVLIAKVQIVKVKIKKKLRNQK